MNKITHQVPYLPEGREIFEVPASNVYMARALAHVEDMDRRGANRATYSIVVLNDEIIAESENGSVHAGTFCPRTALRSPSGQEYEYCPDHCEFSTHSEARTSRKALIVAKERGLDLSGAILYMAGHWWGCKPCWDAIVAANIGALCIVEGAYEKYNDNVRRAVRGNFGMLEKPIKVVVLGDEREAMIEALRRVNFSITEEAPAADAIILLPGASFDDRAASGVIYDYRKEIDYRHSLTRLSQDLERQALK